jgi:nucleoid-associated protein YgaU
MSAPFTAPIIEVASLMFELACSHCGRIVQISPDAARCSVCGEDLHSLIPADYSARYFYRRAADLAARGDAKSALGEAERGIDFHESSELRLLAAILSKRLGDADHMRRHVAAIPVDDRLRQEAEWLVRAQDARRQAEQSAGKPVTQAAKRQKRRDPDRLPRSIDDVIVSSAKSQQAESTPWTQRLWGAVAMMLLVIVGGIGWILLSGGPDALLSLVQRGASESTSAPTDTGQTRPLLPTPTPKATATVPGDLVQLPQDEPVAGADGSQILTTSPEVALDQVLRASGRPDLADLEISARLELTRLLITGAVTNYDDRRTAIELASGIPGVGSVDAVNLIVRAPATYTVQAGDTLWAIAYKFYGEDPNRVAELYEANRDVMASPEALAVEMVLKLPPNE